MRINCGQEETFFFIKFYYNVSNNSLICMLLLFSLERSRNMIVWGAKCKYNFSWINYFFLSVFVFRVVLVISVPFEAILHIFSSLCLSCSIVEPCDWLSRSARKLRTVKLIRPTGFSLIYEKCLSRLVLLRLVYCNYNNINVLIA